MRKSMPLLAAAALSILLSGCFTSQTPKFPMSSAVPALGDGGRYVMSNHVGKGKFKREQVLTAPTSSSLTSSTSPGRRARRNSRSTRSATA
jgi:hypothetical protein